MNFMLSDEEFEYERRKQIVRNHQASLDSDQFVNTSDKKNNKKLPSEFNRFENDFNNRPELKDMSDGELRDNTEKLKL